MLIIRVVAFCALVYIIYYIVRKVMEDVDDYFVSRDEIDSNLPRDKHKPNGG